MGDAQGPRVQSNRTDCKRQVAILGVHLGEGKARSPGSKRDGPRKWTQAKMVSKGYSFQNSEGEESKRQLWGGEWPGTRVDTSVSEVKVISDSCDRFSKLQL